MENPTLRRIEAEYLNGVRSGNVRKKRLRNRNRRIRRDRASGNVLHRPRSQVRTEPRHTSPNHQPALETPTGPTRPRRCSGAAGHYVRTYSAKVCASTAISELLTMFWPPSTASRETSFTSSFTTCAQAPPA